MPYVPKTSSVSSKKFQESCGKEESDGSSQSASRVKYPFSHVHHYLKIKDESRRVPSRREAEAVSMSERCDWIRDILSANNLGNDYQYHPLASWLKFYRISLSQYQRHVPDNRKKRWSKKVKPQSIKFSSDSEAEDEDSNVG